MPTMRVVKLLWWSTPGEIWWRAPGLIKGNTIRTPADGVLQRITRKTAIEIGDSISSNVQLCEVPAAMARKAVEVFLTSKGGGVIPVTRIDGNTVGSGKPGPIARQLQTRYWALHDNPSYTLAVNYQSGV
jgi:branched-chain amino acid aminotransferase